MQSTDIFTVGGSLAVNAHGMDPIGSVLSTVKSFTIMLADGTIQTLHYKNNQNFLMPSLAVMDYLVSLLEVELEVTANVMYERDATILYYKDFPEFFEKMQNKYRLFHAHLSTSPLSFLKEIIIYGYKKIEYEGPFKPLGKISLVNLPRFLINLSKRRQCSILN